MLGTRHTSPLAPGELATVAVHEAGHALVAVLSPHADPVSRVTVLGAGQALGLTEMLPVDDRRLYGESYLADTLAVRLGGRAAERLVRGEASTGAADDLASATALATQMVCEFGLSDKVGPVSYNIPPAGHPAGAAARGFSEHTQWLVDQEVAALLATGRGPRQGPAHSPPRGSHSAHGCLAGAGNHHRRRGPRARGGRTGRLHADRAARWAPDSRLNRIDLLTVLVDRSVHINKEAPMKRPRIIMAGVSLAALAAAGGITAASASGTSAASDRQAQATVRTASATVAGKSETILVSRQGLPLYIYRPDTATRSFVTGGLARLWPP